MKIDLIFDYYRKTIYIPDFYTNNTSKLRDDFLEWAKNQSSCVIFHNKQMILSYDAEDFLTYINSEVLKNQDYKAYFIAGEKNRILKRSKNPNSQIKF